MTNKTQNQQLPGIDRFFIILLLLTFAPGLSLIFLAFTRLRDTQEFFFFGYCYTCFIFLNLWAGYIFHLLYRNAEKKKIAFWQALTEGNDLKFRSDPFYRGGGRLVGNYREHHLRVETTRKEFLHTRIILSANIPSPHESLVNNNDTNNRQDTLKEVTTLLDFTKKLTNLRGQINTGENGQVFIYEQTGFEEDMKYVRGIINLFSDLADIYPKVIILGGKIVPYLQSIATNQKHGLRQVAAQWLYDIGQETKTRLSNQASNLLCLDCLARCVAHEIRLNSRKSTVYYGCQVCGQSQNFFKGVVIAILDNTITTEQAQYNGTLRVNWLARCSLFDFDKVEVVRATDEDVERFAIQVGNNTDSTRKSRYKKMNCIIRSGCDLSENTIRILRQVFGQVESQ
jgi:hypothetical protein